MTQDSNPKPHSSRFHGWLERHKIIFEVIAATILGVAGVIVSYLQWNTARLQTAVAVRQTEPIFSISTHVRKPEGEEKYTDEDLFVENIGAAALEPRTRVTTWIYASLIGEKNPSSQKLMIPMSGYFWVETVDGGALTGRLTKYPGDHNNQKWVDLARAARKLATANGFYLELHLRTYAEVTFVDIMRNRQKRFYYVDSIQGAVEISQADGKHFIEDAWSSPELVDFHQITAEKIFELAAKQPTE